MSYLTQDYYYRAEWELYDLRSDPQQLHNLAKHPSHNATFQRLRDQLTSWRHKTQDYWICYPQGVLEGKQCYDALNGL